MIKRALGSNPVVRMQLQPFAKTSNLMIKQQRLMVNNTMNNWSLVCGQRQNMLIPNMRMFSSMSESQNNDTNDEQLMHDTVIESQEEPVETPKGNGNMPRLPKNNKTFKGMLKRYGISSEITKFPKQLLDVDFETVVLVREQQLKD